MRDPSITSDGAVDTPVLADPDDPAGDPRDDDAAADSLVEDVSIDGMCGVY